MVAEPSTSASVRPGERHAAGRVQRQRARLTTVRDQVGQLLRGAATAAAARGPAEAEQDLRRMIDDSAVAICVHAEGRCLYANDTMVHTMAAESAVQLVGHRIIDFVAPQSVPTVLSRTAARQREGDISPPVELVILPLDGTARVVEAVAVRCQWLGRPAHQVAVWDVTAPKAGEAVSAAPDQTALQRAEQHFQTVVASLEEGVIVISAEGIVESVNPAALRIMGMRETGVDALELVTSHPMPIYDSDGELLIVDRPQVLENLKTSPQRGRVCGVDRLDDGRRVWVSANWSLLDPADPTGSSVLVSFTDVTKQHTTYQRLAHQATHDHVTGLPNRAHILDLVTDALEAGDHRLGAVLFIDLDKFKRVNDALGHHAGDAVLRITAERLRAALGPDDLVGRVGGDEFVALLAGPVEHTEADLVAGRLHLALSEPVAAGRDGGGIPDVSCISASIGVVAVRPDEQRDAAEILHEADLAMYQAKERGRASSDGTGVPDRQGPARNGRG
ncbi:diguanylate cyclase domain-containing protein [Mycobacterium sp. Lab-001]|uniref:diguanylate cyclase domain-containing protein n=1 Tax=Mycobacterium sp. Lab-001 TaxID=3410136 RepID=UPI003D180F59